MNRIDTIIRASLAVVGIFTCLYWTFTKFQPNQNWIPIILSLLNTTYLFDWVRRNRDKNGKDKDVPGSGREKDMGPDRLSRTRVDRNWDADTTTRVFQKDLRKRSYYKKRNAHLFVCFFGLRP